MCIDFSNVYFAGMKRAHDFCGITRLKHEEVHLLSKVVTFALPLIFSFLQGFRFDRNNNVELWRVCKKWSMSVYCTHIELTHVEQLLNIAHFKSLQGLRLCFFRATYILSIGENFLNLQTLELMDVQDYRLDLSRLTKCHSLSFFQCRGGLCFRPKVLTKLPPNLTSLRFAQSSVHCLENANLVNLSKLTFSTCEDIIFDNFPTFTALTHLKISNSKLRMSNVDLSLCSSLQMLTWYFTPYDNLILPSNLQILIMFLSEVITNQLFTISPDALLYRVELENWPKDQMQCLEVLSTLKSLMFLKVCGHCTTIRKPNSNCTLELTHVHDEYEGKQK